MGLFEFSEITQGYSGDIFVSDSIALCSWRWKRKCCQNFGVLWSQHQWKECTIPIRFLRACLRNRVKTEEREEYIETQNWSFERQMVDLECSMREMIMLNTHICTLVFFKFSFIWNLFVITLSRKMLVFRNLFILLCFLDFSSCFTYFILQLFLWSWFYLYFDQYVIIL